MTKLSEEGLIFRDAEEAVEADNGRTGYQKFRHPVFAWLGLRPIRAQHTREEHEALRKWAQGRRSVVEIGVAEGASALGAREVMASDGAMYLIDPFHLSRIPWLNTLRRAAGSAVSKSSNARVVWILQFSHEAALSWREPIDFLFVDGDHSESAVRRDWEDWHRFVVPGGVVVFHDARVFPGGWTTEEYGPVRFVNLVFRGQGTAGWRIVDEVHSLVVVERLVG